MVWSRNLAIALSLAVGLSQASAQTWPTRPVEVIVPFPAGGSVDVIARAVATALGEKLHQQVVVSNRDGASGTVGFNALASAAPDGYTLGAGPTTPIANAPYLMKGVRYNVDSFDYICHVFENAFTIAVAPGSKFKSIKELLDAAKANPGKLSYGHSGNGTIPHLSVANLADALGIKFQPVPFRGESALMPVLLKGDIDFGALAVVSRSGGRISARSRYSPTGAIPRCRTSRRCASSASRPRCRPARTASLRPRDCRPRSRRPWNAPARKWSRNRPCCAPWRIPDRRCIT